MGTCPQKHIAFWDYKVIFSSNLTVVNFKGISVGPGPHHCWLPACGGVGQHRPWPRACLRVPSRGRGGRCPRRASGTVRNPKLTNISFFRYKEIWVTNFNPETKRWSSQFGSVFICPLKGVLSKTWLKASIRPSRESLAFEITICWKMWEQINPQVYLEGGCTGVSPPAALPGPRLPALFPRWPNGTGSHSQRGGGPCGPADPPDCRQDFGNFLCFHKTDVRWESSCLPCSPLLHRGRLAAGGGGQATRPSTGVW